MKKLKAVDLFAGIGGIKQGLEKSGFDVVFSNDIDKYCKTTFEANFKEKLDTRDIKTIPLSDIPDHDLLSAGFPCQPFSLAGLKKGFNDPRGDLFMEIVRILKEKRPKAFLLENVKHLVNHNGGETLAYMLKILRDNLGYFVPEPKILNSKFFGVPQNRQRVYIVGFREPTEFSFPNTLDKEVKLSDILEDNVDESYFLSQMYYEGLVKHKERHRSKGSGFGFEILDPEGIAHALVVGNMGRERNLIKDKPGKGFYKKGMDRKLSKNSEGIRKLTIRECARLQGFPEDFTFPVSRTQVYKQLGNTISIPVIAEIAKEIYKILMKSQAKYQPTPFFNTLHIDNM